MNRVQIPAPAYAANLMQDAAEGLTGDPLANCVLIAQTCNGDQLVIAATPWDEGEIRGLMFRAAAALPTKPDLPAWWKGPAPDVPNLD